MESNPSPSPSTFSKSQINPSKPHKIPLGPLPCIFFFFFLSLNLPTTTTSFREISYPTPQIPYSQHCNDVVPESPLASNSNSSLYSSFSTSQFLRFHTAFFSGGDQIFNQTSHSKFKSLSFSPFRSEQTVSNGVYNVRGTLHLQNLVSFAGFANPGRRKLRQIRFRGPRLVPWRGSMGFSLNGFWSESSGKLCMVGSRSSYNSGNEKQFDVVLKLNYPKNYSIFGSLITGTLDILSNKDVSKSFEPVSILGLSLNSNYEYTLVENENRSGCLSGSGGGGGDSLSLNKGFHGPCAMFNRHLNRFELEYGSDCGSVNCNPLGGSLGYLPSSLIYDGTMCRDKGKVQMLLGFPNSSYSGNGFPFPFDPNATLIAEGAWDEMENRLCGVACRILNVTAGSWANVFVGDCSIKLSLRFPAVFTIRNRSTVVGEIWSKKNVNDSGYFRKIGFQGNWGGGIALQGVKYEYTEIDTVRKTCTKGKTVRGKGKTYPDGYSFDMRFDMSVRDSKGKVASGYSSPIFVGDQPYVRRYYGHNLGQPTRLTEPAAVQLNNNHSSMLNMSYKMSFTTPPDFRFGGDNSSKVVRISAEGIYDRDTGLLCMMGCQHLESNDQRLIKKGSLDCEIMVNVQFPSLNAEGGEIVKGTIESTREKSDPLYFERLQLFANSITTSQAKASIWRMDLEITMVLISNTFACVFVGLQLFYVKKHPHVLPFISIMMLVVLTLGHMIPLLLNFEALFVANHNQTNVFLGSGGWLEVNEVIVRVVIMVAFLLQLRLLQLTWSARQGDGNGSQKGWWASERKVLYVTLPLYIAGGLIACFVHLWKNSYQSPAGPFLQPRNYTMRTLPRFSYKSRSFWVAFKSYAGLLLDGFLLPQILFNLFVSSGDKALASSFYVGTTIVRLLPHAYDLYRAHSSSWYLDLSYIYANHRMDFYSTAWDIIIPCGGLLFAVLIYVQQQFGGRSILPRRFRESSVYEKVPVISNDEL